MENKIPHSAYPCSVKEMPPNTNKGWKIISKMNIKTSHLERDKQIPYPLPYWFTLKDKEYAPHTPPKHN